MEEKKISKKDMKEHRAWAVLIPKIEEIIKYDIASEHKVLLIKYEIEVARERGKSFWEKWD